MILNLAKPENTEVKFEISKFPDGQQNVKVWGIDKQVTIKSRLNNFSDLELIVCATKSLRTAGVKEIKLYTPYFLGSRSDRQFESGGNNYLKDVICPIINSLGFSEVSVLDPHSDVLEACLNNFKGIKNTDFANWALGLIAEFKRTYPNTLLMSPDGGALKKIHGIAEYVNYTGEIITCSKSRGIDGKLSKQIVPRFDLSKDVVIIDDICDGGATFINIAKVIQERKEQAERETKIAIKDWGKLYLAITHGIFSRGFSELEKYFDEIYCTNSYSDKENWDLEFGKPSYSREAKFVNNRIKQYNVW